MKSFVDHFGNCRVSSFLMIVLLFLSGCREGSVDELRVLTYNIHHGETVQGKMNIEAMAEVILSVKPHLVALQEVDIHTDRVGGVSLLDQLVDRCAMQAYFAKALEFGGGEYGNAVLSGYPILEVKTHLLPSSPDYEQRVAADCLIALPTDTVRFISTHFDHHSKNTDRRAQAAELYKLFHSDRVASILAGDLNDTPDSEPLRILRQYWVTSAPDNAYTVPVENPERKIDYVLHGPAGAWEVIRTEVLPAAVSDHLAVLAVLRKRKQ